MVELLTGDHNILPILAYDQNWGDVGSHGKKNPAMPLKVMVATNTTVGYGRSSKGPLRCNM